MFKLGQSDRFTYPVSIEVLDESGKRKTYSFDAVFKRLSNDQFIEVSRAAKAGELPDLDLVRDVLLGWKGILDEDGNELTFSEANRDMVLNVWPVTPTIVSAFLEANTPKGKQKNSQR